MARNPFSRLFSRPEPPQPEQRSAAMALLEQFGDEIFSNFSTAGKPVTTDNALQHSAVWASIRVISEAIATLPLQVVERTDKGRRIASWHPLYNVLHNSPSEKLTSYSLRVAAMHHVLTCGNAYIRIHRGIVEQDTWLELLDPKSVRVKQDRERVYYDVDQVGPVQSYDMIHLRGLSLDGVVGLSPIAYHRNTIGAGLSASEYSAEMMANGITHKVYGTTSANLTAEQVDVISKQLRSKFASGVRGNDKGMPLLVGGVELKPVTITPEDAQFLEQRKFSVIEIARIFRVPPHMIGDLDRATFSNIEHQGIEFVQYSLLPWIKSIEQEIDRKLFREVDKARFSCKLSVDGLLRGDIATRAAYYQAAINTGWMTRNEARRLENMPPIEGGDIPLVPLNLGTLKDLNKDE